MSHMTYQFIPAQDVTESQLRECSTLFSTHYGHWENNHTPIKLTPRALQSGFLFNEHCFLVIARQDEQLIAHALGTTFTLSVEDHASEQASTLSIRWITQLVVDPGYRHQGIAKTLIRSLISPEVDGY